MLTFSKQLLLIKQVVPASSNTGIELERSRRSPEQLPSRNSASMSSVESDKGKMKIFVKIHWPNLKGSKILTVNVDPTDTFEKVLKKVEDVEGGLVTDEWECFIGGLGPSQTLDHRRTLAGINVMNFLQQKKLTLFWC